VSDQLSSAISSRTRTSPQWSPASSGPAASSHGSVGPSCSARGLHAPGKSLPGPARVCHSLSSMTGLGGFRWFRGLLAVLCCCGVSSGGACGTRAVARDGASEAGPDFVLIVLWCSISFF
jgi:hypothetical protein